MNIKMLLLPIMLLSFCVCSVLGGEGTEEQRLVVPQLKHKSTYHIINATIQYVRPGSTISIDDFWKKIEAAEKVLKEENTTVIEEVVKEARAEEENQATEKDTVGQIPGDRDLSPQESVMNGQYVFEMHFYKGIEYFKKQFGNLRKIIKNSGSKLKIKKLIVYKYPQQDYKSSVIIVGLTDQFEDVGVEIRNIEQNGEQNSQ